LIPKFQETQNERQTIAESTEANENQTKLITKLSETTVGRRKHPPEIDPRMLGDLSRFKLF